MSSGNCTYSYWHDLPSSDCSGHGECVGKNTCICYDGWTGESDWINLKGQDCHQPTWFRNVLIAPCIINFCLFLQTCWMIREAHLQARTSKEKEFRVFFSKRPHRVMVLLALTAIMITVICLVRFLHPGSKFGPESPGIFTLWYVLMITICWLLAFLLRLFVHLSTKSLVKQKDSKAKDILKIVDRAFLVFPILLTLGWIISWISGCVANSLESFDLPRQRDNIDGMMKPNPFKTWTMCSYYFLLLMCWLSFSFVLFVQLLSALESVTIAFRGIGKDIWGDLKGHQTLIEAKTNLKKLILFLFLLGCVLGGSTFFALTVPNHAKYFVWLLVCLFVAYPVTAIPCGWLFFKTFVRKTRTGRMLSVAGSGTHNRPSSAGATPKRETKSGTSLKIDESEEGAEKLTTIRISMHAAHHDPSFHL